MEPTLVIMAAGMGSRFGGLKQITPVDSFGHILIDYSVYDAMHAGFKRVIFIIKKENEEDFRCILLPRQKRWVIKVDIVYQELDFIPDEYTVPEGRIRPWGTAHAIACLYGEVDSPFAVINADDFYGRSAFQKIYDFLYREDAARSELAMIGYRLSNTLSKNGSVSRGVCRGDQGYLGDIREVRGIVSNNDNVIVDAEKNRLDPSSVVSMNLWGLKPYVITKCKQGVADFLNKELTCNPLECEYYLPTVISGLVRDGDARVKVIPCNEIWHGVTYKEDREEISFSLDKLIRNGIYPYDM